MTGPEVQRALRLLTSPEYRRKHHFPISVLANMSGLSRESIYQARNGNMLTPRVVTVLAPILKDIFAGKLIAKRSRSYTVTTHTVTQ
jgi:predicted transcriptional regulator